MKLKRGEWVIAIFTLAYLLAYTLYYLSIRNFEFLWYIVVTAFFFGLIFFTIRKSKFDYFILWGLSIWGLLHMSGGGLVVNGNVLYNLTLFHIFTIGDTPVFRFDQFVHIFGFFFAALVAFHLIKGQVKNKPRWILIYFLAVLVSMGLGALNEIVEFAATVSFTQVNVGGYYNTALDLVSNMIGALLAIFVMRRRRFKNA